LHKFANFNNITKSEGNIIVRARSGSSQ